MYCKNCTSQMDDGARFCINCGAPAQQQPYDYPVAYPAPRKQNTLALVGLILAVVMPLPGLVVSIVARSQCRETGEDGENLAKIGIIVGAVRLALNFIVIIASFFLPFAMFGLMGSTSVMEAFEGML